MTKTERLKIWKKVNTLIEKAERITISTHVNPDGDAIGSSLALFQFLTRKGKKVHLLPPSPLPAEFNFLAGADKFQAFQESDIPYLMKSDLAIILDIGNPLRLKKIWEIILQRDIPRICIDHHPDNHEGFTLKLIDTSTPATGYLIWEYINHFNPDLIDRSIAELLYTALMTDTGSFRFENSSAEAHRMAMECIQHGVRPDLIYREIYENDSLSRIRLLGKVLCDFQLEMDGKLAWFIITKETLKSSHATEEDIEGFTDFLRRLKGLEIAIMFQERNNHITRVNFRSKGAYKVNEIAALFGGGGHPCAAGCVIEKPLDQVIKEVLEKTKTVIREGEKIER